MSNHKDVPDFFDTLEEDGYPIGEFLDAYYKAHHPEIWALCHGKKAAAGTKSLPPTARELPAEVKKVTRNFRDALGRRVCIQDGERVPCHDTNEAQDYRQPAGEDANHAAARVAQGQFPAGAKPAVPRRLTRENLKAQGPDVTVVIWTDKGGFASVAAPDSWGKFSRWVSARSGKAPALARFTKEGWTDEVGNVISDFSRIGEKSEDPDTDSAFHAVLNALQAQPGAALAVVTVDTENPDYRAPRAKPEEPPQVGKSPFGKKGLDFFVKGVGEAPQPPTDPHPAPPPPSSRDERPTEPHVPKAPPVAPSPFRRPVKRTSLDIPNASELDHHVRGIGGAIDARDREAAQAHIDEAHRNLGTEGLRDIAAHLGMPSPTNKRIFEDRIHGEINAAEEEDRRPADSGGISPEAAAPPDMVEKYLDKIRAAVDDGEAVDVGRLVQNFINQLDSPDGFDERAFFRMKEALSIPEGAVMKDYLVKLAGDKAAELAAERNTGLPELEVDETSHEPDEHSQANATWRATAGKAPSVGGRKYLGGGKNTTVILTLAGGERGVYKPVQGEDPHLRSNIPNRTYYRREVAASLFADALGFGDLVPSTTFRDEDEMTGSLQQFIEGEVAKYMGEKAWDGPEDNARAAAFDYLIGNTDRHDGNWVLGDRTKLKLIDNGLAFPVRPGGFYSELFDKAASPYFSDDPTDPGRRSRIYVLPDFTALRSRWSAAEKVLREAGLEEEAIALTKLRFNHLTSGRYKTFKELPNPNDLELT